jgi:serine/threonine-protein kinase
MPETLAPGTLLSRYRLDALVGQGGMGAVYRATRVDDGAVVAIKTLHPQIAKKLEWQKRFLREARAAMAASHPNVVRIYEVFEHDDTPVLAMELLDGEPLEALLERDPRVPLDRLARIFIRVTSAVGTAHAMGIIHRDLKPDNIFLGRGNEAQVKVLDFGIAKLTATQGAAAETAALTKTGALMGTPFYMSPEQAFGEKKIDQRADIWSLGVILYQCISGVLPTRGNSFAEVFRHVVAGNFTPLATLAPDVPADVADLVGRMLSRDPAGRPWDLREVHAVLERYAEASAPAFGIAVAPLFDELTAESGVSIQVAAAGERPATGEGATIALTPSSLKLDGTAPRAPSPTGTVMMDDAAVKRTPTSAPPQPLSEVPKPPTNNLGAILAGVALLILALTAIYYFAGR